ncbi:LLM class F420-dependent oxidoreductase [Amycolatopsis orientalis]|uniref:LLM class F420-dependent oxidoreductase n=1 Tax=Amycolatopsis orientalis TaxID=31958 RepID=A0A193C0C1_AMYOR|nr:LLM class F420-dependent oxidoreductase [Amycolatopsis orientalis]ANN17864.1 LLM class F420-dependent oxidoreductase [Amycolatopsis orientalis]
MRISVSITDFSWPGGQAGLVDGLTAVAAAADEGGLDTLWVADHLLQTAPGSAPDSEMLEAYTTLGYLASATSRIRLGTMVSAATFRAPALLVKAVTTLDVLSRGRAWLGIGAGYQEDEARAMGLSLPPVAERFERLEETLQIAGRMWDGDTSAFTGRHYRLERPVGNPPPVRRPKVLIGGTGPNKTLRLVARYADACNLFDVPDGGATVRGHLDVLARHCADLGRPIGEIEKTIATRLAPGESSVDFARRCEEFASWGIDHAVVITAGPWRPDAVAVLAEATSLAAA